MRNLLARWAIGLVMLWGVGGFAADASAASDEADSHAAAGTVAHDQDEHHAADEHHAEHAEGVPLDFKSDLALWSVVTFVVFLLVLTKFAWKPLIEGLDKREAQVRQDLADAEAARVKAEQLLAEHEEKLAKAQDDVREIVAEGRRDAEHARQEMLSQAQQDAEATRQRAVEEIERARDEALKEVFNVMAGQVVNATAHVLGRSVTDDDQDRLIQEALAEMAGESGT